MVFEIISHARNGRKVVLRGFVRRGDQNLLYETISLQAINFLSLFSSFACLVQKTLLTFRMRIITLATVRQVITESA